MISEFIGKLSKQNYAKIPKKVFKKDGSINEKFLETKPNLFKRAPFISPGQGEGTGGTDITFTTDVYPFEQYANPLNDVTDICTDWGLRNITRVPLQGGKSLKLVASKNGVYDQLAMDFISPSKPFGEPNQCRVEAKIFGIPAGETHFNFIVKEQETVCVSFNGVEHESDFLKSVDSPFEPYRPRYVTTYGGVPGDEPLESEFIPNWGSKLCDSLGIERSLEELRNFVVESIDAAKLMEVLRECVPGDPLRFSMLDRLASLGCLNFVLFLLSRGADVNETDVFGHTALHWAHRNGHLDVAAALVKHGARVDAKNYRGVVPADYVKTKNESVSEAGIGLGEKKKCDLILERSIVPAEEFTVNGGPKGIPAEPLELVVPDGIEYSKRHFLIGSVSKGVSLKQWDVACIDTPGIRDISLVDSPGLGDCNTLSSEVLKQVSNANVVIYVFNLGKSSRMGNLTQSELGKMKLLLPKNNISLGFRGKYSDMVVPIEIKRTKWGRVTSIGFSKGLLHFATNSDRVDVRGETDLCVRTLGGTRSQSCGKSTTLNTFGHAEKSIPVLRVVTRGLGRYMINAPQQVTVQEKEKSKISFSDITKGMKIGEGGMGKVYLGTWEKGGGKVQVAIKKIKLRNSLTDSDLMEFYAMSNCHSPRVVQVFGYCYSPEEKIVFIVMKRMAMGLNNYIHEVKRGELTLKEKLQLMKMTTQCIHYLHHERRIIHRDIKSSNFLVNNLGDEVVVADFGLVRTRWKSQSKLKSSAKGTLQWMAPELFDFPAVYSEKSDGMVFYEILMGKVPFEDEYGQGIMGDGNIAMTVLAKKYRPKFTDEVPKKYSALVEKCWDQDPKKRPSTGEILDAITLLEEGRGRGRKKKKDVKTKDLIK